MLPKEQFLQSNFTVDDVVAKGHDRKEVIDTLRRLERDGLGKFITGRRGAKSRWEWNNMALAVKQSSPAPSTPIVSKPTQGFEAFLAKVKSEEQGQSEEQAQPEPKITHVEPSGKKRERDPFLVIRDLREGVTQPKAPVSEKEMIDRLTFITGFNGQHTFDEVCAYIEKMVNTLHQLEKSVVVEEPPGIVHVDAAFLYGDGPGFWDADTRQAIAKELTIYRRGK